MIISALEELEAEQAELDHDIMLIEVLQELPDNTRDYHDFLSKVDFRGRPPGFKVANSVSRRLSQVHSLVGDFYQDELFLATPYLRKQFVSHYRIHPRTLYLLEWKIEDSYKERRVYQSYKYGENSASSLSCRKRLLITLWRFATGETFRGIAHRFRLSESRANRAYHATKPHLALLAQDGLARRFEKWKANPHPVQCKKLFPFPGVHGAIDGAHVPITIGEPAKEDYINRKGVSAVPHYIPYGPLLTQLCDSLSTPLAGHSQFPSLNVVVMCNAYGHIVYIQAGTKGSQHDMTALKESDLMKKKLLQLEVPPDAQQAQADSDPGSHQRRPGPPQEVPRIRLLGDAAYEADVTSDFILTPYKRDSTGLGLTPTQEEFNVIQCNPRQLVENSIGRWKLRWRDLLYSLAYKELTESSPETKTVPEMNSLQVSWQATCMICAFLHNLCEDELLFLEYDEVAFDPSWDQPPLELAQFWRASSQHSRSPESSSSSAASVLPSNRTLRKYAFLGSKRPGGKPRRRRRLQGSNSLNPSQLESEGPDAAEAAQAMVLHPREARRLESVANPTPRASLNSSSKSVSDEASPASTLPGVPPRHDRSGALLHAALDSEEGVLPQRRRRQVNGPEDAQWLRKNDRFFRPGRRNTQATWSYRHFFRKAPRGTIPIPPSAVDLMHIGVEAKFVRECICDVISVALDDAAGRRVLQLERENRLLEDLRDDKVELPQGRAMPRDTSQAWPWKYGSELCSTLLSPRLGMRYLSAESKLRWPPVTTRSTSTREFPCQACSQLEMGNVCRHHEYLSRFFSRFEKDELPLRKSIRESVRQSRGGQRLPADLATQAGDTISSNKRRRIDVERGEGSR